MLSIVSLSTSKYTTSLANQPRSKARQKHRGGGLGVRRPPPRAKNIPKRSTLSA